MAGLNTLEASNIVLPKDLVITAQPNIDSNFFTVTAKGLAVDSAYNFQFQWVYADGTVGPWSTSVFLTTPTESVPGAPSVSVPSTATGYIPVTLNTFPADALRVDVKISGGTFGDGTKVAYSFFSAGTTTIAASAGEYFVQLYTITPTKINGTPTSAFTITVADNVLPDQPSVTPSTPTITSVLGAIQLAWDGKTSTGGDQPYGFNAAKVYVGTTAGFTPSALNQVDTLNFANGQNTLNIGVGTIVNGVAMTYATDYYIKIATTNGTDTSTPVLASGSPKQIGQVGSGDIVSIAADKITTGTLQAGSTITVGSPSGKRVELKGTGDPFAIYDTDGTTALLSYGTNKLTIVGDGTFSGNLSIGTSPNIFKAEPETGIWLGGTDGTYANANFRVSTSGILRALSGSIGGWTITANSIYSSSNVAVNRMSLYPNTPQLSLIIPSSFKIELDPTNGLKFSKIGDQAGNTVTSIPFQVSPNGNMALSGNITSTATIAGGTIEGAIIQTAAAGQRVRIDTTNSILFYDANISNGPGSMYANGHAIYFTAPLPSGGTSSTITMYGSGGGISANLISLKAGSGSNEIRVSPTEVRRQGAVDGGGTAIELRNIFATQSIQDVSGTASLVDDGTIRLNYTVV